VPLLEVPLFQVAAPLIRRIGMLTALLTCMLAGCIRFFGYVVSPSVWWVLPFEFLHGWIFAIMYTSMALLAEESAADGLQATVQGLGSSAMQLGSFTAALVWSAILGSVGLRAAFSVASAVFGVAALPLIAQFACCARHRLASRCRRRGDADPMLDRSTRRSDAVAA
jgi:PPP family 3-phenylpropionic acid transporter